MFKIALFAWLGLMLVFRGLKSIWGALYGALIVGVCYLLQRFWPGLAYTSDYALFATGILHLMFVNLFVFYLYWFDKRAAKKQKYRIPEATLHAFAVVGGTPFALIARLLLRHKTKKVSFRIDFWLIAAGQVALAVYLARYFLR